jgi:hypothetical protein
MRTFSDFIKAPAPFRAQNLIGSFYPDWTSIFSPNFLGHPRFINSTARGGSGDIGYLFHAARSNAV